MARFYHDDHLELVAGGIVNAERENRLSEVRTCYSKKKGGHVIQARLGYHWHNVTGPHSFTKDDVHALKRQIERIAGIA